MAETTHPKPRTSTPSSSETPVSRFDQFYQSHKDAIGYIGVAAAIVLALIILINMNKQAKEQQASVQFQEAVNAFQNRLNSLAQVQTADTDAPPPATKDPISEIQELVDNYPSTHASANAQLLKAGVLITEGKNQEALQAYSEWITSHPGHALLPGALLGKSTAEMNLTQVSESLKTLQDLRTQYPDSLMMDIVIFETGKRFESLENWESARQSYQELIDRYPDSAWRSTAQTKLTEIDRKHPSGPSEKPEADQKG